MNKNIKALMTGCVLIILSASLCYAKDVQFEATLDKDKVSIGDTVQLGLTFRGTQSMPAPDIGNISGLEMRYVGPSTMMTVINGQMSSSITHMYSVLPLKTGKFNIGPFSFKYKNDMYTSNSVSLEAVEERMAREERAEPSSIEKLNLDDRIFLTLNVQKSSAYVNELIPVTVKLYVNRMNVSDIQLPTFEQEGFSKVEFKEPKQYREQTGGVVYDVLEFNTKIFGTKPGDYKLGPAKVKCNIVVRKRVPTRQDMFDQDSPGPSFFDDFLTRYERHPTEIKSQESKLVISALPAEGRPGDYNGAVGDYQFIYGASPTKVKAGDPITVRMEINGTGNLNTVLIPKLEDISGFKAYEAQVRTGENTKTFTQVLIPTTDMVTQIPKATFTFFDVNSKQYKQISQGPIPIQVEKMKEEAPSQVIGPTASVQEPKIEKDEPARDIIYIKEAPGEWALAGYALYKNEWFPFFLALLTLLFVTVFLVQSRRTRLEKDSIYAGRIFALKAAKKGMRMLKNQMHSGDAAGFYETLFKTLQDYLGNRILVPSAGITADIVDYVLESKNIERDMLRRIRDLFTICDRTRFALTEVNDSKMEEDLKELKTVIEYFERNKV